jgi:hypothetical protein
MWAIKMLTLQTIGVLCWGWPIKHCCFNTTVALTAPSWQSLSTRLTWQPMPAAPMQAQVSCWQQPACATIVISCCRACLLAVACPGPAASMHLLHSVVVMQPSHSSCRPAGVETTTFHFQLNYTGLEGALSRMGK